MKNLLKAILPSPILDPLIWYKQHHEWRKRGYLEYAPQFVKQNIFLKYGMPNAQWVETGTFMGSTTVFLAEHFSFVHSIEPSERLFNNALNRLKRKKNVNLYNDVSENVLLSLLPRLNGAINFWLDGHYSGGSTFQGKKECPIENELSAIKSSLSNFTKVIILIDDVRHFSILQTDYPSIDYLVDWAREQKFGWRIEQDIFVMGDHLCGY